MKKNFYIFLASFFFLLSSCQQFDFSTSDIHKTVKENIEQINSHIYSGKFQNFRASVESELDIDHYQTIMHPRMASYHHQYSRFDDSYEDHPFSGYKNSNRQHRPKPSYPHAYTGSERSDFSGKFGGRASAVSKEDIEKRIPPREYKKRVLLEDYKSLYSKKRELENLYKDVFYGRQQILKTFWMEKLENAFQNSPRNIDFVLSLKNELMNCGIWWDEIEHEFDEETVFMFHVIDYDKDLDSEYLPALKMYVPCLGIN